MTPSSSDTFMWFVGIFEGEGSFWFVHGQPKGLKIQMTDLDVLNRVVDLVGGSLVVAAKQEEHHKQSWIWSLYGQPSVNVAKKMYPYLGFRRQTRCEEYLLKYQTQEQYNETRKTRTRNLVLVAWELREQGMTHKQIAEKMGVDRTYVSHMLRGKFDLMVPVVQG